MVTRLAVAQDQQACGWHALGQHLLAQGGGGQCRKPRVQRGGDGFAWGGHGILLFCMDAEGPDRALIANSCGCSERQISRPAGNVQQPYGFCLGVLFMLLFCPPVTLAEGQ